MKPDGELCPDMEAEDVDPNAFFIDLGMLILESRIPEFSTNGRKEGVHCPRVGMSVNHLCNIQNNIMCKKAEIFRSQMQMLFKNNIPMMIEVLLYPSCTHGFLMADVIDPAPSISEDVVLLERWNIQVIPRRILDQRVCARNLMLAIRSYLHFSQLSAWLSLSKGKLPQNIVHRVCVPGEAGANQFIQNPESHTFPSPNLNKTCSIKVIVETLPRQHTLPVVNCTLCVEDLTLSRKSESNFLKASDINQSRDGPSFRKKEWIESCDCPECQLINENSKLSSLKNVKEVLESSRQNLCKYINRCSSPTDLKIRTIKDVFDSSRSSLESSPRSSPLNFRTKGFKEINESSRYENESNNGSRTNSVCSSPITIKSKVGKDSWQTDLDTFFQCSSPRISPLPFKAKTMKDIYAISRSEIEPFLNQNSSPSSPARRCKQIRSNSKGLLDSDSNSSNLQYNSKIMKAHSLRNKCELLENDLVTLSPKLKHHEFNPDNFLSNSNNPIVNNFCSELSVEQTKKYLHHLDASRYPHKMKFCDSFDHSNLGSQLPLVCNNVNNNTLPTIAKNNGFDSEKVENELKCTITKGRLPLRTLADEKIHTKIPDQFQVSDESNLINKTSLSAVEYDAIIKKNSKENINVNVNNLQRHNQLYTGLSFSSTNNDIMQDDTNSTFIEHLENDISLNQETSNSNDHSVQESHPVIGLKCNSNMKYVESLKLNISETSTSNNISPLPTYQNALTPMDHLAILQNIQSVDTHKVLSTEPCINEFFSGFKKSKPLLKQLLLKEKNKFEEQSMIQKNYQLNKPVVPTAQDKAKFRKSFDSATSMVFHNKTGLPLTSSPAPLRRGQNCFEFDNSLITVQAIKSAFYDNESEECGKIKKVLSTGAPASTSTNGLLGNFEESVLNGRLEPIGTVEGFSAEIGASGAFCPSHVHLPVTTFFYQLSDDLAASPYLGHINLESLVKKAYHIPKKGNIQVTLFNPNKTVVKMFVVMYDLSDMPANMQTFLRQRTYYLPILGVCSDSPLPNPKWLKYLIHLRFVSTKSGKIYLHTDIRLMFSRKSEIDATFPSTYELRSFTEGPVNPRFSPRRLKKGSHMYL